MHSIVILRYLLELLGLAGGPRPRVAAGPPPVSRPARALRGRRPAGLD
jgi:hypothetical protein